MSKDQLQEGMLPIIDRSVVETELTLAKTILESVTIPVLEGAKETIKKNGLKDKSLINKEDQFFRITSFKKDGIVSGLHEFSQLLLTQIVEVEALLDKHLPKTMTREAMTYSQFAYIRFANVTEFCASYMSDFFRYLMVLETCHLNKKPVSDYLSKGFINRIESGWTDFFSSASLLDKSAKEVVKLLEETPDLIMTKSDHRMAQATHSNLTPLRSGFVSTQFNPIYRIRMALAEFSAMRYRKAQESLRMYEIQLEYLEQSRTGEVDPTVERRIEELTAIIDDINYDLIKMEKRYG